MRVETFPNVDIDERIGMVREYLTFRRIGMPAQLREPEHIVSASAHGKLWISSTGDEQLQLEHPVSNIAGYSSMRGIV